ncbi:Zn-dependent oxidoreductase [Haladaptatus sp. W1]|uniref:NAD(P)-dependent alcohol dehydrogenase n=1 Tax=Haladaptatus sp. W1 TaxID=1897478 RepID=UPI000849D96F|nr:NAD(P)-dependent alcohol dehydrogenase [Haladaptatus sp. W1]ODR80918.1 Zn-dependent oxidoreductase [Haladaptatus sp. W1]
MKAVVATEYGAPDVLRVTEVPKPTPKDTEILIRITATTVGPSDSAFRQGKPFVVRLFSGLKKPNSVLGDVLAGEVAAVGSDVTRFAEGDRVFGTAAPDSGAHAEYICLPEDGALAIAPSNISDGEAAAVCDGALTAMGFLRDTASIQRGQSLLINGASGSIGTFAVQLAKHFGAEVTGVSSTRNIDLVKSLGADTVIDYTQTDFTTVGEKYDIIFDAVGKSSYSRCKDSLTRDGMYMTTVPSLVILFQMGWTTLFGSKRAVFTATGLKSPEEKVAHLQFLRKRIEAGEVHSMIDRRYSLDEIAEAHRYVDRGHKRGNVVITLGK